MFNTYIRRIFQHSYDAMLAAPVDVHEVVAGEASWIAAKSGGLLVRADAGGAGFGLRPGPGVVLVPFFTLLTGRGFALFGIWASTVVPSINSFDYVITGVLTPLFLSPGTFFPVERAARLGADGRASSTRCYHCVELVRHAVFGAAAARRPRPRGRARWCSRR